MRRLIRIAFLIYLGTRIENYSTKLLVKHGFATVDKYGNLRKADDWDEKINALVNQIGAPNKTT